MQMNRRTALKNTVLATGGLLASVGAQSAVLSSDLTKEKPKLKGRFKHSVSRWCYNDVSLPDLCKAVQSFGMHSIELTAPDEWAVMKEYGLTCAIGWDKYPEGVSLDNFYSNPANHDVLEAYFKKLIPKAVDFGIKNLICLSGKRDGRTDYENLLNCKKGLMRVMPIAEEYGVTISMELLNSKVNHKDHQFDRTEWGVVLCEMVASDNFKLLYDIYHAQIMEGDVVATIQKYHTYISHYHTAGVPGRHEIDDTQELNYRYVMQAIADTGYTGFIGQEFIPTGKTVEQRLAALQTAVKICDI